VIHPDHILQNDTGKPGDLLILTKKLGVGIVCTASRVGEASQEALEAAVSSMTTLNKYGAEIAAGYEVHACTDVTGFGFLGHLHEMMGGHLSCRVFADQVPVIPQALSYADEFLLTAAGQRNRNFVGDKVVFEEVSFAMEEVLFDPQTSGGLLMAVAPQDAEALLKELKGAGLPAGIVGDILEKEEKEIRVVSNIDRKEEKR
jgi:selenide,water dikinase